MRHSIQQQRYQGGFAMAAMFIAVALLGGIVTAIEGPDYDSRTATADSPPQTNQETQTSLYEEE